MDTCEAMDVLDALALDAALYRSYEDPSRPYSDHLRATMALYRLALESVVTVVGAPAVEPESSPLDAPHER